jgi:hypothetical protein
VKSETAIIRTRVVEYAFTLPIRGDNQPVYKEKAGKYLSENQLVESVHGLVKDAVMQAADHGYPVDINQKVIPVGGSCLIPMIQER